MQAVILAGGKGTRLAERLAGKPKPLVEVCGVPLLERQVRMLEAHGVDDVVVLVNHAADQIRDFFSANEFSAKVQIVDDGEPRGTAGAVLACLELLQPRSLIIYGDTLFDIDVSHMVAAHVAAGAEATLLLHPNDHPADSDLVALGAEGFVSAFHAHPHPIDAYRRNLVNAAFYVVEREALLRWRDIRVPSDFGHDLFPLMIEAGQRLLGYVSAEYIKDLGTPSRLDKVERHLLSGMVEGASRRRPQRAVFIDRDGTLNQPAGHIATPEAIELIPGTAAALRRLNDTGARTVLVTNQPVIARGECDLETLDRIHGRLEALLSESGAYLDRIFVCPHHPDGGYLGEVATLKIACDCRKPESGMVEAAIAEVNIDRYRSWMVGDSSRDMGMARRAGLLSMLVQTGEGGRDGEAGDDFDVEVADFAAAADFIVDRYPALIRVAAAYVASVRPGDILLVDEAEAVGLAGVLRNELLSSGKVAVTQMSGRKRGLGPSLADRLEAQDGPEVGTIFILNWPADTAPPNTRRRIQRIRLTDMIESLPS